MGDVYAFLFARPSFLEGFGRVLDIGNTMNEYNSSPTPQIADAMAFRSDLLALQSDLDRARQQLKLTHQQESENGSPR